MLQPHHFKYKCPLKLSDLDESEGGHFCGKCRKDIHDLTDCSLDEIRELQRRKGSICGFVRTIGVTSMVGLASCSKSENPEQAKNEGDPKPQQEQQIPKGIDDVLLGDICVPEDKAKPEPEEKAPPADGSTVKTEPKQADPKEPEIIKPGDIKFDGPVIMGIICPPEEFQPKPDPDKPLDPNRKDSPA